MGGVIEGRLWELEKFSEDGDGNTVECVGCGACIGDCGGMYIAPEGVVVRCGEPATIVATMPYGSLLGSSGEALERVKRP